jgi:alpha-glucoside transport system permease protein
MAISFLAAGVIFRLVYEREPDQGLANAIITTIADPFQPDGSYLGARPGDQDAFPPAGKGYRSREPSSTGEVTGVPVVALLPEDVPDGAEPAAEPEVPDDAFGGVVWLDFTPGGGGERGVVDGDEVGLPGMDVDAVRDGEVVGSATTEADGSFVIEDLPEGDYQVQLAGSNFRAAWNGFNWLGADLVTASTIGAFVWIWAGFAMVVIGAGLAAIPRDVLEASRVDGATEWQVFHRVTVPLLRPVLLVVLVTLVINVLKIFDLVFIIPPGSVQDDATVIALEMWRVSFGGANDQGLGSALSVLLFLLVIPAMAFNIRRFRRDQ